MNVMYLILLVSLCFDQIMCMPNIKTSDDLSKQDQELEVLDFLLDNDEMFEANQKPSNNLRAPSLPGLPSFFPRLNNTGLSNNTISQMLGGDPMKVFLDLMKNSQGASAPTLILRGSSTMVMPFSGLVDMFKGFNSFMNLFKPK